MELSAIFSFLMMIQQKLAIRGIEVFVVRKAIKNIYLSIRPSNGEVRLSVPFPVSEEQVRHIIDCRYSWIMRKREAIQSRLSLQRIKMESGESHYLFDNSYLLDICRREGKPEVRLVDDTFMQMFIQSDAGRDKRLQVLREWYRRQLKDRLEPLVCQWQQRMGVEVTSWNVKRMKTRWGSCNIRAKRIWLNLTLAQYPIKCLEYILVHELVHLLERCHTQRFYTLMDTFLPDWQARDRMLKNRARVPDLHS